jgi:hypothetical protein
MGAKKSIDDDDAVLQALANACVKYDNGWSGCLDLKEPREDPRARKKDVGEDISVEGGESFLIKLTRFAC